MSQTLRRFLSEKFLIVLSLSLILILPTVNLQGQVYFDCIPDEHEPFVLEANACHIDEFTQADIDNLPVVTVRINVHYVNHNGYGNFVHKGPGNWDDDNGYELAQLFIQEANERFADLIEDPNLTSSDYFIGNGKIRYELYTENSNEDDIYGGIWYWDEVPIINNLPYGNNVLHIIFRTRSADDTPSSYATISGNACGYGLCNSMNIFNRYFRVYNGQSPQFWGIGRVINHEFGHIASLCHSIWSNNVCAGNGLNPEAECNNPNSSGSCGGDGGCIWGTSQSMMANNPHQTSMTKCEWNEMMTFIYNKGANYLTFCDELSPPLVIESNTQQIWDETKIMNRDIILEPLSELIIRCETRMGKGARIHVNRGSRLIVEEGGSLVNLCTDEKWRGIMLYGNNAVAHTPGMVGDPLDANNPGIVIMEDAILRGAEEGIYCNPPLPWPDLADYWNGIVKCVNTEFIDNTRSVAFMKTEVFNISSFIGCNFKNTDGTAKRGITNWRTNHVLVEDCNFSNLNEMAIQTWDAGISIRKSTFIDNNFAIHATATTPQLAALIIGGNDVQDGNHFITNQYGVYASTMNNMEVKNNSFLDNQIAMYALGQSEFEVFSNNFVGGVAGLANFQTNTGYKLARCNTYNNLIGVYNGGNNHGLRIRYEEFNDPYDVVLSNYDLDPGYMSHQGNASNPVLNHFTENSEQHIVTTGTTLSFNYFYPDLSLVSQRAKPLCSLNDPTGQGGAICGTQNNFNSYELVGIGANNQCLLGGGESGGNHTMGDYDAIHQSQIAVETQLASSGDSATLLPILDQLTYERERIVYFLGKQWQATNHSDSLMMLYQAEQDERKQISLLISEGSYNDALVVLNAMSTTNTDDSYFNFVQNINLDYLTNTGAFELVAGDSIALYSIADSKMRSAYYAQSLLNLLYGAVFIPDIPLIAQERSSQGIKQPILEELILTPNPTRDEVNVQFPNTLQSENTVLVLVDMYGRELVRIPAGSLTSITLSTANYPSGLYIIQLLEHGQLVGTAKLMVQH